MKIRLKKGLDLRLEGGLKDPKAPKNIKVENTSRAAISPDDFEGFIPKTEVKEGQKVKAGDALLYHKNDSRIKLCSPVTGTVAGVVRGERRHIDRIVVECDRQSETGTEGYKKFDVSPERLKTAESRIELLAESGLLAFIRRRPYADVPKVETRPRDIFVSAFDSAPLAVTRTWTAEDAKALEAGAKFLSGITEGKVYVSSRAEDRMPRIEGAVNVEIKGPHPAGLPGVQAANIAPVNKGETIWTLTAETMWRIGKLVTEGVFDPTTFVTVCGSRIKEPFIVKTVIGADVSPILEGQIKEDGHHVRTIAGNVLTGKKLAGEDMYLHFPYTQITAIPEGDDVDEFMGWASISPKKMSLSPSFPGKLLKKTFNPDARINGGRRAMIMSGEYDRVLPMDILAEYLIKAVKSRNVEEMEKLGIYEVAPEDFALAECIDSSKQPLQQIIREGLDYLRKELE